MKYRLLGAMAFAALASAGPALAADLKVKAPVLKAPVAVPAPNWTGFYVGGHLGYLWGRTRVEENGVVTEPRAPTNGIVGGALAGMNWQTGAFVLGVEADIGATNAHGTGEVIVQPPPTTPNQYDFNWIAHVRGRAGYAFDGFLVFIAGGLAVADFDFREGSNPAPVGAVYTGGSIGGGIEYAFTPQVSGRIEFLHDDFGSKTYIANGDSYRVRLTGNTLRGAVNIRLWDGR